MPSKPAEAYSSQIWTPGTGQDPAKYLVDPGHWNANTKRMTPGELAHARPWLDSGNRVFVWPTPTEGFRRTGQSTLGLHHYIGDQYVDAQIVHRDEARVEMNGVFSGLSGQEAMVDLGNTLNDDPPDSGMSLHIPGVFDQLKWVIPENWEFTHDADDQTHSISYTITFVMIGEGRRTLDPAGDAPDANPDVFPNPDLSDWGPPDPWQIAIGIGAATNQPGNDFFFGPDWTTAPPSGISGGGDGGGGAGPEGVDMVDFMYRNDVDGYTPGELYAAALAAHPDWTPMHIMKEGDIFMHGDQPGVDMKFQAPDGNTTEWVPLPAKGSGTSGSGGSGLSVSTRSVARALPSSSGQSRIVNFTPPRSMESSAVVTENNRTLQHMADLVYGSTSSWEDLYNKNQRLFDAMGVQRYEAPTAIMPVGTRLMY